MIMHSKRIVLYYKSTQAEVTFFFQYIISIVNKHHTHTCITSLSAFLFLYQDSILSTPTPQHPFLSPYFPPPLCISTFHSLSVTPALSVSVSLSHLPDRITGLHQHIVHCSEVATPTEVSAPSDENFVTDSQDNSRLLPSDSTSTTWWRAKSVLLQLQKIENSYTNIKKDKKQQQQKKNSCIHKQLICTTECQSI